MPPRLKTLELHGYKTFATRTEFQFPGIITAIVGPNGSGKSNIADALRWVLGEQSYSLLRGRKTEDMIFAGSEQRSRAGMASATIGFDNSDGWLPIDYSEVAITRRAYRDGQNEYLLNGQRVRLREISELLARSGLAERTYTIIGQGLVDAALALKPEERRRLFEEAAGIGLYRLRREESINRLESTRRNLDRVQDILVELEPRLRSLEKQARRVQEYERLKGELRSLLREWYGYHWHRSQQDLAHAREVHHAQENRLEQARKRYQEISEEVLAFRTQIQEIRNGLSGWHGQSAELHKSRERVNRELAILEERNRSLSEQEQSLQGDLVRLEEEVLSNQDRIRSAEEQKRIIEEDLSEAQRELELAQTALRDRQNKRVEAEKSLRAVRQQLVSAETRLVQLKAHQEEIQNRLDTQVRSLESSTGTISKLEAEFAKTQEKLEETVRHRQEADANRQTAVGDLQSCRHQKITLETDRKRLQEGLNRLDTESARLRAQIEVLEQAERNYSGLAEGARFLLQASRQGKLAGKFRPLTSRLDVPAEYETAIAAALGEYFDVVWLDRGTDPDQAMHLLEGSDKGRAAILPEDWMIDPHRPGCPADPDCLGNAADLVNQTDGMGPAVDLLLGRTLIVRDRQAARRVLQNSSDFDRCVTLKGEVFHINGTVIAGRETRGGALSKPRQKRELQEAFAGLEKRMEDQKRQLSDLDQAYARQRTVEADLERTMRTANTAYDRTVEAFQHASLAAEQARRQLDWQVSQRKSVEALITKSKDESSQTGKEAASTEEKIRSFREQVRQASAMLAGFPVEELQTQVSHWSMAAAVAGRAVKDALTSLEEHKQTVLKNQERLAGYRGRREGIRASLERVDAENARLQAEEADLAGKIEALRVHIDPAEKEIQRAEKEYADLQNVEAASQQALTVAERYEAQAQLEMTRQRESLDHLRRRIEEDFGLVALEYEDDVSGPTPLPLEGMVEQLPMVMEVSGDLETSLSRLRAQIRRLGAVNLEAQAEYVEVRDRYQFMTSQVSDLKNADADLRQIITELDELMKREFRKTFEAVAAEFHHMFARLFVGGSARLVLIEGENQADAGIDIETRLPGRREQGLSLLSGGERSLTAVALVFALLKISPTPFCVLDEVDAMLDEANVGRFRELLRELSQTTQFIVITHNRNTVQAADVIYGVTMGRDSTSQVISLKLDEISEEMVR